MRGIECMWLSTQDLVHTLNSMEQFSCIYILQYYNQSCSKSKAAALLTERVK